MLDLESALNKLQSLEDRGISSDIVDLPSDEFVLYLVYKSLEQQCACDHKGFYFLIIDPLEEEPFDDVLFNVELNKTRLHANSKIKVSCLKDRIKKKEKLFTVGLDSFDTAESIIKWICWGTSPENLSLLEKKTMRNLKRSRMNESAKNNIFELWIDILGFMEDENEGLVSVDTKMTNIYVFVDHYNGNFAWRFEKKDDKILVDVNNLTDNAHEKWIIETKEDLDSFMNYFD